MKSAQVPNAMVADAVRWFWKHRDQARTTQSAAGKSDQGQRAAVTAGKHMDGFLHYIRHIVTSAGLPRDSVITDRNSVCLPGYARPSKRWDLVVLHNKVLLAVMELKSHIGPSFGNNFNNRAEEALGTAYDFQLALQNGIIPGPKPFVGYLMLLEDCPGSTRGRRHDRTVIPTVGINSGQSSYEERYDILCQRLVGAKLYDSATLLLSPQNENGTYRESRNSTSLSMFTTRLQKHLQKARTQKLKD